MSISILLAYLEDEPRCHLNVPLVIKAIQDNPSLLTITTQKDSLLQQWAVKLTKLLQANSQSSDSSAEKIAWAAATLIRITAANSEVLLATHVSSWCNILQNNIKRSTKLTAFKGAVETLRYLIVRSAKIPNLPKDVASVNIPKCLLQLHQKLALDPAYLLIFLNEFIQYARSFPSITKTMADKVEGVCIETLSNDCINPQLQSLACSALIMAFQIHQGKHDSSFIVAKFTHSLSSLLNTIFDGVEEYQGPVGDEEPFLRISELPSENKARYTQLMQRFLALSSCLKRSMCSHNNHLEVIKPKLLVSLVSRLLDSYHYKTVKNTHDPAILSYIQLIQPSLFEEAFMILDTMYTIYGKNIMINHAVIQHMYHNALNVSRELKSLQVPVYNSLSTYMDTFGLVSASMCNPTFAKIMIESLNANISTEIQKPASVGLINLRMALAVAKCILASMRYSHLSETNTCKDLMQNVVTALFNIEYNAYLLQLAQPQQLANLQIALLSCVVTGTLSSLAVGFPFEWISYTQKLLLNGLRNPNHMVREWCSKTLERFAQNAFASRPPLMQYTTQPSQPHTMDDPMHTFKLSNHTQPSGLSGLSQLSHAVLPISGPTFTFANETPTAAMKSPRRLSDTLPEAKRTKVDIEEKFLGAKPTLGTDIAPMTTDVVEDTLDIQDDEKNGSLFGTEAHMEETKAREETLQAIEVNEEEKPTNASKTASPLKINNDNGHADVKMGYGGDDNDDSDDDDIELPEINIDDYDA
ncbi:hypothetical protein HDV05_004929 [Chytridiales sp. JEL 0842]|nr:hypothetical protein HDV05_004929 [Chytridiales sp. JEL 0842]